MCAIIYFLIASNACFCYLLFTVGGCCHQPWIGLLILFLGGGFPGVWFVEVCLMEKRSLGSVVVSFLLS